MREWRKWGVVLGIIALGALLGGCAHLVGPEAPGGALDPAAPPVGVPGATFAPDQLLVKFKPGAAPDAVAAVHGRLGGQVVQVIPRIDVHVVRIPLGRVPEFVQAYLGEDIVEFAEPDRVAMAYYVPNDPGYANQWALPRIHQGVAAGLLQAIRTQAARRET